jgi:hypothetical protein
MERWVGFYLHLYIIKFMNFKYLLCQLGILLALPVLVEIDSDHFLIMKEPKLVQNAIETWLETQAGQQ